MKILVLDNYDSFTYNLVHIIKELGHGEGMDIFRNDKISMEEINGYDKILLSPGPGIPSEAGIMQELIKKYASTKSILGVCLGHQGIAEAFGAKLYNLPHVVHGLAMENHVVEKEEALFKDLPSDFKVGRYHSWVVDKNSDLEQFHITATDEKGEIMAITHKQYDLRGVQFHPESVLTEYGKEIMQNWLNIA